MTSPQIHLWKFWYITCQFVHIALHSIVRGKKSKLADRKLTNAGSHWRTSACSCWRRVRRYGRLPSSSLRHNGGTTIYQTRKLEKPSKRLFPNFFKEREVPRLIRLRRIHYRRIHTRIRGAGMTTLFLLVTGGCQSLNELGVVSVTKKWSGQNRTSRTACYGPGSICITPLWVIHWH